ncbi:hypothetical protein LguiB_036015 [Lonicera macranthoides]
MAFSYRDVPVTFDRGTPLHKALQLVFQWQVPVVEWLNQALRRIHVLMNASHPLSGALLLPPPALTFVSAASAPACSITYAITAQSLTGELKWIAAGRIATDESRSAADSLAVGSFEEDKVDLMEVQQALPPVPEIYEPLPLAQEPVPPLFEIQAAEVNQ